MDLSVAGAVCFVITASTFLLLLYFFMSTWFVWVLIVLFCIGGIQVQNEFWFLFPFLIKRILNSGMKKTDYEQIFLFVI